MRIESGASPPAVAQAKLAIQQRLESLLTWPDIPYSHVPGRAGGGPSPFDSAAISASARLISTPAAAAGPGPANEASRHARLTPLLIALVAAVTGQKVRIADIIATPVLVGSRETPTTFVSPVRPPVAAPSVRAVALGIAGIAPGPGRSAFTVEGFIQTADGTAVHFTLQPTAPRTLAALRAISRGFGAARFQEPAVVSFGGKTVDLADITFAFHLDADGTPEQAAAFRGSALFVFDRDMNGRPRNGAELFGPRSSANFHERREEDEHPGGWSDEEDAAHQLLRLLSKDSNLNDGLEGSADLDGDATGFDRAVGAGCAVKHIDLAV